MNDETPEEIAPRGTPREGPEISANPPIYETEDEDTEPETIANGDMGKDEMTLVEYPISLIAERVPKRKQCNRCKASYPNTRKLKICPSCEKEGTEEHLALVDLKKIEWTDWKTIDGVKVQQRVVVSGSEEHGLPTGPDNDILIAILEAGRQAGFKGRSISLHNAYAILKRVTHTGGSNYERFIRAIGRWATLSVHTEHTLFDKQKQRYERRTGFNLVDSYDIITKEQRADPTKPTGKRDAIVYGHITLTERFARMVTENVKDLDLKFYRALASAPSPTVTKKLYRYLDKHRWYGGYFAMDAKKLCRKLGFDLEALETYRPAKIRGMLTPALAALKERNFLREHAFRRTTKGQKLVVYFVVAGVGAKDRRPFGLDEEQLAYAQLLAEDIADVCEQREKNKGFYFKTAGEAIRDGNEHTLVRMCLSETKAAKLEGRIEASASQYFSSCLSEKKRQFNLPFSKPA